MATWGDYLIAARATPSVARPGTPVDLRMRAVDYRGGGVAGIPVAVQLVRTEWDSNAQQQRREVLVSDTTTTGADGRATWQTRAPSSPGSYLLEARAMSGDARGDRQRLPVGARRDRGDLHERQRVDRTRDRQEHLRAGRHGEGGRARRRPDDAGAADEGGAHADLVRPAPAVARRHRSTCRSPTATSATRGSTCST